MELRHLRYFVAVAEELHFGRAAERLFMAQPPLSQQIQQLEQEMKVQLFERTNRRVQLTEAGRAFYEETIAILARVDQAVRHAQRISQGDAGWLGVGFVTSATFGVLPDILRRFREQYPEVELALIELHGGEQGQALREKRIHVGFTRLPGIEPGILREPVAQEPLLVALPSSHPLAAHRSVQLDALAAESFIQFPHETQSGYAGYIVQICQRAGFTPNITQKTGELLTAVSLVAAGIGITVVPAPIENLRREGVVYRPLEDSTGAAPTIELTMAYRDQDRSPVLPHFLTIAREAVRDGQSS